MGKELCKASVGKGEMARAEEWSIGMVKTLGIILCEETGACEFRKRQIQGVEGWKNRECSLTVEHFGKGFRYTQSGPQAELWLMVEVPGRNILVQVSDIILYN